MIKMSKTLLVIAMGVSLGACSSTDGKNTFMTYTDLQDRVQAHENQWQALQPKLDRLEILEAQVAALTQGDEVLSSVRGLPESENAADLALEPSTSSDFVQSINVAPAIRVSSADGDLPLKGSVNAVTSEESASFEETVVMNRAVPSIVTAPIAPVATPTPMTAQSSQYGVQLAAYGIREEAIRGWRVLQSAHPESFDGLVPLLNEREVNGRSMYQLKVGPFLSRSFSADFCSRLKSKGQDCLLTQYDGQAL